MSWNKGFNKFTHPSVMKISRTLKKKKIDNFKQWREKMRLIGIIPADYPPLTRNSELAELIGVVLGDGNIEKLPRTERLIIVGDKAKPGYICRYAEIVERIFRKTPYVYKVSYSNAVRISVYQKNISSRLGIPSGSRKMYDFKIPKWILRDKLYIISFLKGLFEAEGSLSIHLPTCTYNFQFSNRNKSLLKAVELLLRKLGFNPEVRTVAVRLRRRAEVLEFEKLIRFRLDKYNAGWCNW